VTARNVLVTGAAGPIGLAIVDRFLRSGSHVVALDVRDDALAESLSTLKTPGTVDTWTADLSDPRATDDLVPAVWDKHGPIDVLVNVAALAPIDRFLDMTAKQWDLVMGVNVRAPMQLTVALGQKVIEHERTASVVTISSGSALRARPGAAHYTTSKAAVEMLVRNAAIELAPHVRVNAVSPGFIDTRSPVNFASREYARLMGVNPMGRPGRGEDIADAVHWMASEEASWVTGTVLRVDGGSTAGMSTLPLQNVGEEDA
jgi:3-oxoacyl-[acyl-carrier protein] reductase